MVNSLQPDVAIVGASLAGCAAARLFAQQGLKVVLIERQPAIDAHKRLCTHFIQPSAIGTVQRLGLESLLEAAGGVRSRMEIWSHWGWIRRPSDSPPETYGYSIRRQTLDPILRRLAAETPGVELLLGWKADEVLRTGARVTALRLRDVKGSTVDVTARLVVAADGRYSSVAKLAGVQEKTSPNDRFTYYAYYRGLPLSSGRDSQLWHLDPDVAYGLVCDGGLTLLCAWITKDKLDAFRDDPDRSFDEFVRALPDAPDFSGAERVSPLMGSLDLPVRRRKSAEPGLALIGDAALAADPLNGVGCGWALQSAEWLVDCTAKALVSQTERQLDDALRQYERQHRRQLKAHDAQITAFARGRPSSFIDRMLMRAATRDPVIRDLFLGLSARTIQPSQFLAPTAVARLLWANLFGPASSNGAAESASRQVEYAQ